MKHVRVVYREEGGSWWAGSPDVPGYSAAADTLPELCTLVLEGMPLLLEDVVAVKFEPTPPPVPDPGQTAIAQIRLWVSTSSDEGWRTKIDEAHLSHSDADLVTTTN